MYTAIITAAGEIATTAIKEAYNNDSTSDAAATKTPEDNVASAQESSRKLIQLITQALNATDPMPANKADDKKAAADDGQKQANDKKAEQSDDNKKAALTEQVKVNQAAAAATDSDKA